MSLPIPPDRRSITSALNGRLSNGPATEAGKLRSSRNALRHGLLSQCLVLEDESPEAFQTLLAQHVARLGPADHVECAIVEEMTASVWRLRRSWAIETGMLDTAAAVPDAPPDPIARIASALTACAESSALPLAHETRLHMMYPRALHNLLLLRAAVSRRTGARRTPRLPVIEALPALNEFPNEPNFHREQNPGACISESEPRRIGAYAPTSVGGVDPIHTSSSCSTFQQLC